MAFLPLTAPGAAAEYVSAPAETLAAAPRTVDLADAAALPSAGLPSRQALFEHAEVKAGQSVLVNGAVFVSTTTPGPDDAGRGVRTVRVFARSDATRLTELVTRVDAGELKIEVAERRPLADLAAVHDEATAGRLTGKTVLTPA